MSKIVVGIDLSEPAKRALRFAVDLAASTGDRVEVVSAYTPPLNREVDPTRSPIIGVSTLQAELGESVREYNEQVRAEALQHATSHVRRIMSDVTDEHPGVEIDSTVERSTKAARVLLRHATDAKMLVVGSRGLGGFTGLLLGSVSQQLVHHARCPVVVVP